jgi:hypothetical protein
MGPDAERDSGSRRRVLCGDPVVTEEASRVPSLQRADVFGEVQGLVREPSARGRDPLADEVGDLVAWERSDRNGWTRDRASAPHTNGYDRTARETTPGTRSDLLYEPASTRELIEHEPMRDADSKTCAVEPLVSADHAEAD